MNPLSSVQSDTCILQIITQEELERLTKSFRDTIRDIHKTERNNSIVINVFGYENKKKNFISVSKKCYEEKHINLLLIEEKGKRHYFLIKDFNIFMYDHTLDRERKQFCR